MTQKPTTLQYKNPDIHHPLLNSDLTPVLPHFHFLKCFSLNELFLFYHHSHVLDAGYISKGCQELFPFLFSLS